MATASLQSNAEAELQKLGKALSLYQSVSRRSVTQTLWKKGYDLRIQLFRGFSGRKWKGRTRGAKQFEGVAFSEMRRRARSGGGIQLRPGLQASASAPDAYVQRRRLRGRAGTIRRLIVPVKMSNYRRLVWTELARRQSGAGVLSVSFLMRRWNANRSELIRNSTRLDQLGSVSVDTFEQRSRSGALFGRVILGTDSVRLSGFTDGLSRVGDRYGIISRALSAVTADTLPYLQRKLGPDFVAAMRANGLSAA